MSPPHALSTMRWTLLLTLIACQTARTEDWSWLVPGSHGNSLLTAAYAPGTGRVVAGGFGGDILTKAGVGGVWTTVRLPTDVISEVVWTGSEFVAAGRGWIGQSTDGLVWSPVPKVASDKLYTALAHGSEMVVALSGTEVLVRVDPLRSKWRKHKLRAGKDAYGNPLPMNDIAYGRGLFVVVGPRGTIATSRDAKKWTSWSVGTEESINFVEFTGSFFVACGENVLLTSTDGLNWLAMPPPVRSYESEYFSYRPLAAGDQLYLEDNSGSGLYRYIGGVAPWSAVTADSTDWIRSACPDGADGVYFVGSGGRVARRISGSDVLQQEIDTGAKSTSGYGLQSFVGLLRDSFFRADDTGSYYYDKAAKQWRPFSEGLPPGQTFAPHGFHQAGQRIIASAEDGLYVYEDLSWSKLGPRPAPATSSRILCLTTSPAGRTVAVCDEGGSYRLYISDDWINWRSADFSGELPQDFPAMEKIVHDGQRFILLAERGNLFISETGEAWSRLPSLPEDSLELLTAYQLEDRPRGNQILDFATDGSRIVATAGKWQTKSEPGESPRYEMQFSEDFLRFFVYRLPGTAGQWSWLFAPGSGAGVNSWTWVSGEVGERVMRTDVRTPILWTGSAFVAVPFGADDFSLESSLASGGRIYTSEDGFDWKLRDLPAYGILTATWTRTHIAVLTAGGSIATHPTGVSSETGSQAQTISFRLPKKLYVGRSYTLRPMTKSKLPVSLALFDQNNASLALKRRGRRLVPTLTILGPGTNSVTAYQAGNRKWRAAKPVSVAFEAIPRP